MPTARIHSAEALRLSESLVRSTLDSLAAHIAVVGEDGEILATNSAWRSFAAANGGGPGLEAGARANYLSVCDAAVADGVESAGAFAAGLRAVLAREIPAFEWEYPCHSPDIQRWFLARVTPVGNGAHRAVVAHENITQRVLAERQLQHQAAMLREAGEIAHVGGWEFDPGTGEGSWTAEVARIHDLDPSLPTTRALGLDFYQGESRARIEAAVAAATERGEPYDLELEMTTARGARKWVRLIANPEVRDGKVVRLRGSIQDISERRIAAEKLADSEAHYRALAETTFDWIWEVDADGRYTFVSPRVEQLLGHAPEEVLGRMPFDFMPPGEAERVGAIYWGHVVRQAPFANLENVNRHKDGALVVLESSGVPYFGPAGDFRGYRGMDRDITARKQAERRSATQAAVSRVLAGSSSLGEAARELLQAIGEPEGWSFGALWECDQRASSLACVSWWAGTGVDAADLGEATGRIRLRCGEGFPGRIWAQGRPLWVADLSSDGAFSRRKEAAALGLQGAVGFPIRLGDGILGVVEFLGTRMSEPDLALHNVFDAIGRQIGLFVDRRQSEATVRRFVSGSPAVIYALRVEPTGQRLLWFSDNLERMTGWASIPEDGAKWWLANIHQDDLGSVQESFAEPYVRDHLVLEFRFRRPDGRYLWVRDERRMLRDADGEPTEILGSWTDVTERVELEEKLRVAQKLEAIGRLAGGVAHDFNNMLMVISGNGEMLDRALPPDSSERALLAEIREAAERSASLTRQLLAFSRTQVLAPRVLPLAAVVTGVETMLRRLIGEDVTLFCELDPEAGHVLVDRSQLEQVIVNLAVNARDAMPRGGTLTVATSAVDLDERACRRLGELAPGTFARLEVRDTGHGMSPEVLERIFEPFFTTKPVGTGTGLGLSTVFGIVKQSGGHIEVESTEGRGATFVIYLPRVAPPALERVDEEVVAGASRGSETVLVVEDEAGVRRVVRLALEKQGYRLLVAASGREAVALAEQHSGTIELLLTDLVMPEMSGSELAGILRARRPGLAVLLMSGYVEDDFVRHGVVTEEVAFLHKPFTLAELAAKVRATLDAASG